MARPTHSFSWLRGVIKLAQLATGSAVSGTIPVSNGSTTVWTDPTSLPGYGGGGGGGGGGWVIDGADGTKLEAGRFFVKSVSEGSYLYLSETGIDVSAGGQLYLEAADEPIVMYADEGLVLPSPAAPPTYWDDGHVYVETRGGNLHFLEMIQPDIVYPEQWFHAGVPTTGWTPQAFPIGYVHDGVYTTARNLASYETLAIPLIVPAPMNVVSMRFWNTDTTLARSWETSLWHQPFQDTGSNVLKKVPGSHQYGSTTASSAGMRSVSMGSTECYCPAGLVWFTLMNTHATNTLGVGYLAGSTQMPVNLAQRKVLTSTAFDADTLDFTAATWTKLTDIHAASLTGRVFNTAAF